MRITAAKPEIKSLSGVKDLEKEIFGWIFPTILSSSIPNQSRKNLQPAHYMQKSHFLPPRGGIQFGFRFVAEILIRAWKRVRANKGSPGIDGITVDDLTGYLKENWPRIREELLRGEYRRFSAYFP